MFSEKQMGEYRTLYILRTRSHSSMVSLTMSAERGECLERKIEGESQRGL